MRKLYLVISVFLACSFLALPTWALDVELRPGDVLLLELNCYSCQRIANETKGRFSHSGVLIKSQRTGELVVAEALGSVKSVSLKEFVQRSAPGASVLVMRSFEIEDRLEGASNQFVKEITRVFHRSFKGLKFDRLYLWDRLDEQGRPMLYCSEFVAKFLNNFLLDDFTPHPLDFSDNWEFWQRYFRGQVPQGELGNSPQDLARDSRLYEVGEIWPGQL